MSSYRSLSRYFASGLVFTAGITLYSQNPRASSPAQITIETNEIVNPVSPMLYGLMTEEINHSYDGGLYAELIRNRTFHRGRGSAEGWTLVRDGDAKAHMSSDMTSGPSQALTNSMKLTVDAASAGNAAGLSNAGWWGIPVLPHTTYQGSVYAKIDGASIGPMSVRLINDDSGAIVAQGQIDLRTGDWNRYTFALTTETLAPSSHNHFQLVLNRPGTLWLQLVSLFPPTYANRANGNRIDLMEMMSAMHPKFLRLPGGNYLEGDQIADRFDWKHQRGLLVDRPGHMAPWTYWSTDGLGLPEFLSWCEDLHVEPILAVYAGYSLKGSYVNPGKELDSYVQDALDEVEYVTGDTSTKWGALRASDGHPAPYPLHYIEIGNEDWFDKSGSYDGRFAQFAQALRKKFPQYKLIATTTLKTTQPGAEPDLTDDHYYRTPAEMFDLVTHYDTAPRNGPNIFIGEWATRSASPTPDFGDALGDAAWMTSMERNSDLILLASYAPLFVNVNPGAMQWPTDLIGYDAQSSFGSPSYYAQALFAEHLGDGKPRSTVTGGGNRFFYSATVSSADHVLHLKLVNASNLDQPVALNLEGLGAGKHMAKVETLHAGSFEATNSITAPKAIHPVMSTLQVDTPAMHHVLLPYTIEVMDIPLR